MCHRTSYTCSICFVDAGWYLFECEETYRTGYPCPKQREPSKPPVATSTRHINHRVNASARANPSTESYAAGLVVPPSHAPSRQVSHKNFSRPHVKAASSNPITPATYRQRSSAIVRGTSPSLARATPAELYSPCRLKTPAPSPSPRRLSKIPPAPTGSAHAATPPSHTIIAPDATITNPKRRSPRYSNRRRLGAHTRSTPQTRPTQQQHQQQPPSPRQSPNRGRRSLQRPQRFTPLPPLPEPRVPPPIQPAFRQRLSGEEIGLAFYTLHTDAATSGSDTAHAAEDTVRNKEQETAERERLRETPSPTRVLVERQNSSEPCVTCRLQQQRYAGAGAGTGNGTSTSKATAAAAPSAGDPKSREKGNAAAGAAKPSGLEVLLGLKGLDASMHARGSGAAPAGDRAREKDRPRLSKELSKRQSAVWRMWR